MLWAVTLLQAALAMSEAAWTLSPLGVLDLPDGARALGAQAQKENSTDASFAELESDMAGDSPLRAAVAPLRAAVAPGGATTTFRGKHADEVATQPAERLLDEEAPKAPPDEDAPAPEPASAPAGGQVEEPAGGQEPAAEPAARAGPKAQAARAHRAWSASLDDGVHVALLEHPESAEASIEPSEPRAAARTPRPSAAAPPSALLEAAARARLLGSGSSGMIMALLLSGAFIVVFLGVYKYYSTPQNSLNTAKNDDFVQKPLSSNASDGSGTPRARRCCSLAFADRDVKKLADLMDDDMPIGPLPTQLHPWAKAPQTTGALAATYLASMIAEDRELYIDDILESGGLGKLVAFLAGPLDQQHAAISALSILSEDTACAEAMLDAGCVENLANLLRSGGAWPRSSAALALRNLFVADPQKKHAFVAKHGIQGFTALLKENEVEIQLDALLTLLDVIEDESHAGADDALAPDPQILAAIKRSDPWVDDRLHVLAQSRHDDIAQHAQDLLAALHGTPR